MSMDQRPSIAVDHREYDEATAALRARIAVIVSPLEVIGYKIAAVDDRVVGLATAVRDELTLLRPEVEALAARCPYTVYVPCGGYRSDDAVSDLERGLARAEGALTHRDIILAGRRTAARQATARAAVAEATARVAALTGEARDLRRRYEATTADSDDGAAVRIRGFELMAELADARDTLNSSRVAAGDMSEGAAASRRAVNDHDRDTAATALRELRAAHTQIAASE